MKTEEFGLDKKKRRENKKKGAAGTSMSIWTTPVERRLGRRLRWIVAGVAAAALLVSFTSAAGARTRNKKKKNDENEHTHTHKKKRIGFLWQSNQSLICFFLIPTRSGS